MTASSVSANLSTLWVFVLLNMLFRDIHELFRAGLLEQMISGVVNGTAITEDLMLVSGILLQIPLLMIVFSRLLKPRISRIANLVTAPLLALSLITTGVQDKDDVLFLFVELVGLLTIFWMAKKWKINKD